MMKIFEDVFEKVMEELSITSWYVLFDSDEFEIVEKRISECLGYDCWECKEFIQWQHEMAEDL